MVSYDLSDLNAATRSIIINFSHNQKLNEQVRFIASHYESPSDIANALKDFLIEELTNETTNPILRDLASAAIASADC